jgi:hypothetical protein
MFSARVNALPREGDAESGGGGVYAFEGGGKAVMVTGAEEGGR